MADRLYGILLCTMPRAFRDSYAHDARAVFRDLCQDALTAGGPLAVAAVVRRTLFSTLSGALAEHWGTIRQTLRRQPKRRRPPKHRSIRGTLVHMWHDVVFALRAYAKRPGFALTSVATIAVGIGAATTIFSVVDGVLLRELPYPEADKLIYFDQGSHPGPALQDWRERLTAFDQIAAVWPSSEDLTNEGNPVQVTIARTTPNLIPMIGAQPAIGRFLTEGDAVAGANPVAVISHDLWTSRWGGDSTVLGRTLRLDDRPYEVVGVAGADVTAPLRIVRRKPDVWLPLDVSREDLQRRTLYVLGVLGHLAPDASLDQAAEQMRAWEDWARTTFPEHYARSGGGDVGGSESAAPIAPLIPLHEATVRDARLALYMLFGAVGMMLFIACLNVANLFLANGSTRIREMAVRTALGATRSRILYQSLTESVVLSVAGGVAGVALAVLGVKAVVALAPANIPRLAEVGVDYRVLAFATMMAVLTGVLFGLAPAIYAAGIDVHEALKDTGQRVTAGRGRVRLKGALVVIELALAIVLLVGAGLMFNSFVALNRVDPGFVSRNLLTMSLQLGPTYDEPVGARLQFARDIVQNVRAIPGVQVASAGVTIPFGRGGRCCYMTNARYEAGGLTDSSRVVIHPIGPRYLETLGANLVRGREFTWDEETAGESVTLISRRMAERFFGAEDPLGKAITVGRSETAYRVVGVFEEMLFWSLSEDEDVDIFVPYDAIAEDMPIFSVIARTGQDPSTVIPAMRQAVWDLDPNLPASDIATMDVRVRETITDTRFLSILLLAFSVVASLLAATGVYGTMLYVVAQRQHEFGVRIALGASTGQLLSHVMKHGAKLTIAGLVVGAAGALASTRVLSSMLFGVTPTHAPTFAAVSVFLAIVALLACYVPARRAATVSPVTSLRNE
jgi:putative ABC transport system permease protein